MPAPGGGQVSGAIGLATCVHCGEDFRFEPKDELKLVKCPHCRSETTLGQRGLDHIKSKGTGYCCLGVFLLLLGVVVTASTYMLAKPGGHYILYIGGFIAGIVYLVKGMSLHSAETSKITYLVPVSNFLEQSDLHSDAVATADHDEMEADTNAGPKTVGVYERV